MRSSIISTVISSLIFLTAAAAPVRATDTAPTGFGAIGDSFVDEYQFYAPDRSQARNMVEILSATRGLNFGAFTTSDRPAPRYQGYANDWGLTGATSNDLPAETSGLAAQEAMGQVGLSFMFIGGNDFIDAVESKNPAAAVAAVPAHLLSNVLTSISTLLAANPKAEIAVANVFDLADLPLTQQLLKAGVVTPAELAAVSQAITGYDAALASALASNPRVALVDVNALASLFVGQKTITLDGQTFDTVDPGDEYHHLFLADGLHLGTVGQGFLADGFISAVDSKFNTGIAPLSPSEIIQFAQSVKPSGVPLPPAKGLGLVGFIVLAFTAGVRKYKSDHSGF